MGEYLARLCRRDDAAMSADSLNLLGGHRHVAGPLSSEGNLGFGLLDWTVAVCGVIYLLGGTVLVLGPPQISKEWRRWDTAWTLL
jgi:hypothetical protein